MFRDISARKVISLCSYSPDQLEYRNGVCARRDGYRSDLPACQRAGIPDALYARSSAGACVPRPQGLHRKQLPSELSHKKAMFALLTDDALTAEVPDHERKAIKSTCVYA